MWLLLTFTVIHVASVRAKTVALTAIAMRVKSVSRQPGHTATLVVVANPALMSVGRPLVPQWQDAATFAVTLGIGDATVRCSVAEILARARTHTHTHTHAHTIDDKIATV